MKKETLPVCDYTGFDYKGQFWDKSNRKYEHLCEIYTVKKCCKQLPSPPMIVLDAGCGFGRMFPAYAEFGKSFILLDHAPNMLAEAQKQIGKKENVTFVKGNVLDMPLLDGSVDLVVSVRTLHHIESPEAFFKEIYRVLTPDGCCIFEIPNKRHLINILKFSVGQFRLKPFSKSPLKLSEHFFNFHPDQILSVLEAQGFQVLNSLNTSFFRNEALKNVLPAKPLSLLDRGFQLLFSKFNLTPSIFILAQKKEKQSAQSTANSGPQ